MELTVHSQRRNLKSQNKTCTMGLKISQLLFLHNVKMYCLNMLISSALVFKPSVPRNEWFWLRSSHTRTGGMPPGCEIIYSEASKWIKQWNSDYSRNQIKLNQIKSKIIHLLPLGLDHGHVLDPGNVPHYADVMIVLVKTFLFGLLSSRFDYNDKVVIIILDPPPQDMMIWYDKQIIIGQDISSEWDNLWWHNDDYVHDSMMTIIMIIIIIIVMMIIK